MGIVPHRIVILGGGTGGTLVANRLQRAYGDAAQIVVVDRDDEHVYQPGLLFVPFGLAQPDDLVRSRKAQLHKDVDFVLAEIDRVDLPEQMVHLTEGVALGYDVLVIATGASLLPQETDGLTWGGSVHSFYSRGSAAALRDALARFSGGRLVVDVVDMPIKCPVAPLEFCFLADWQLRERGIRDDVQLTFVTPLDAAFTRPAAAERLGELLERKGVALESEFATGQVDPASGRLISFDEREVPFDLLVVIPVHGGADYVGRSPGLGDAMNFVPADLHTLQTNAAPNVFAIGDATNLPTSKAGSVTHFEGETLVENVHRLLAGEPLQGSYDGHANCFVETGFHKALLIDFNYDVQPLPGRYPNPRLGPLPLLAESRLNHLAKLAFQSLYWHALLPGHDLPGISAQLSHGRPSPTSGAAT
jgi:sulfide:quinone oxidoreductase